MSYKEYEDTEERITDRWGTRLSESTVRDRVSFENSIQMMINRCMLCPPEEFEPNTQRFLSSIPTAYQDDEFEEDLKKTMSIIKVVKPMQWCNNFTSYTLENPLLDDAGNVISPIVVEEEDIDPNAIFTSIINLLYRRGMLTRRQTDEYITGSRSKSDTTATSTFICTSCKKEYRTYEEAEACEVSHDGD